jgi:hypothetical protein
MRTTFRLDDHLLADLRRYAASQGVSMTAVLEDALRELFARKRTRGKSRPAKLPTFKGRGVQPGVDLDDSSSLLDLMDGLR